MRRTRFERCEPGRRKALHQGVTMRGRRQVSGAVVVAVVLALGAVGSAQAAGLSPTRARALADTLGDKAAGTYFDRSRDAMVIAVTDRGAAGKVRAAGGAARIVGHSAASPPRPSAPTERAGHNTGTARGGPPAAKPGGGPVGDTGAAPER